jgi:hypothetical protein
MSEQVEMEEDEKMSMNATNQGGDKKRFEVKKVTVNKSKKFVIRISISYTLNVIF